MQILEIFKNDILTNGQKELLANLDIFLNDKTSCFLLKGFAGTGKTFMMKGLTEFLKAVGRPFVLAAPTGRAAKVLSKRTKKPAATIHKTIYSNSDIKEFKIENEDGTETFKFYYKLRNNQDVANTVYIIDEASMISDEYSEGEFFRFGSGFLLRDLLKYVNIDNNDHNKKIIFIGDNAQLPPVNMNFSPALDANYIISHSAYPITVNAYELTEVVRQQTTSGILHNATQMRFALKNNCFNKLNIDTNFYDTKTVTHEDFLTTYIQACGNQIDDETIILAHSNASVKEYNDLVRGHFFPNQSIIAVGDKVMLTSNNYNYEIPLMNGDFGVVRKVIDKLEPRNSPVGQKKSEIEIVLNFRGVVIELEDIDGKLHNIECKIIENILYSGAPNLSSDETKALYIDFKIRTGLQKPETKEFKDALRADPYFNALRVKFGYAITCHKSQGGEWQRAFINCKASMGYANASYFRWLYTAITRGKELLYTTDAPNFGVGSNLKPATIQAITQRQDLIILKPEVLETGLDFGFSEAQENLKIIFYAIFDLLKEEGVGFKNITHHQWCEHYTFVKEEKEATFKIHYNKQNKISKLEKLTTDNAELADSLLQKLKMLVNKTIVLDVEEKNLILEAKVFDFAEPFLQDFYDAVLSKISNQNIVVSDIKQSQYLQKYTFKKGAFVAVIDFHYNGKGKFTKRTPQPNESTSAELLNEILALIQVNF